MKAHAPWEGSRTSEIHKSVYIRTLACAGLQEFYLKFVKQGQSLEALLVFPARASWLPPKVPMILGNCSRVQDTVLLFFLLQLKLEGAL